MKINILSIAEKYPGQGVYSVSQDHKYLLKKYADYEVYENKLFGDFDILHIHTVNPKSFFSLLFHRKKSYNVISAHIVPNSLKGSLKLNKILMFLFKIYLKYFYILTDTVLAVSEETKKELIDDLKIKEEKILVFNNFVRRDLFYTDPENKAKKKNLLRKKYNYNPEDFIILSVGQIQPRKGVFDFYELAKKEKNMKFIWVGGMPFKDFTEDYKEMKELIKNIPKNLKFVGNVDREKIIDYYLLSDVFFLPSIHETFGLVVPEAAGSGLPIVLRDLDVYKTIFAPYYLAGNNIEDFLSIFKKLKNDKNLYKEYELNSYNLFEKYSEENVFKKLKVIYETGVSKKGGKNV